MQDKTGRSRANQKCYAQSVRSTSHLRVAFQLGAFSQQYFTADCLVSVNRPMHAQSAPAVALERPLILSSTKGSRGKGLPPLSPAPPIPAEPPPLRFGQSRLTIPNTCATITVSASLRSDCCSPSLRNAVRLPSGTDVHLHRNTQLTLSLDSSRVPYLPVQCFNGVTQSSARRK